MQQSGRGGLDLGFLLQVPCALDTTVGSSSVPPTLSGGSRLKWYHAGPCVVSEWGICASVQTCETPVHMHAPTAHNMGNTQGPNSPPGWGLGLGFTPGC